jgi:hypothetical protein
MVSAMADDRDRIALSPSPQMMRYIKQLIGAGVYGNDKTTVATRFLEEGVRRALETGVIHKESADD